MMKLKRWGSIGMGLLLAFSLTACGGGKEASGTPTTNSDQGKELVIVNWGGSLSDAQQKAMFEPFEKKEGVKITVVSPTDYGKLKAMVESKNVEWDVALVDNDFIPRGEKDNLLEPLDYQQIQKEGVMPELIEEYGIGTDLWSTVISYNTKTFTADNHPKTWADFWNVEKFPGPRSLQKSPITTLEIALLADGVKPDALYPLDVDRAFQSLDNIKSHVKYWWTAGAQPPQMLANGEIVLATAWNGRISSAQKEGAPVDVEFNQGLIRADSFVIPKGSPNKDLAMKFIAFALEPEQQAEFSKNIDYAPANTKALELLSNDIKSRLGQSPDKSEGQLVVNINWWLENYDKVNERFQQWLIQ